MRILLPKVPNCGTRRKYWKNFGQNTEKFSQFCPLWPLEQRLDLCRRLRQGVPGCRVALVVDEVCEPQLADQVRRAKKDGLIDGFFYSSVSSDYLSAMIDAL